MKYSIKITYPSGVVAYMSHNNRTEWCRSQAYKHLRDWVHLHGIHVEIVEA